MNSPLENKPEILERIGLFIVLFNGIDNVLSVEFYYIIDQSDKDRRLILDFLVTQDFSKKLDMLKPILGQDLYSKIKEINAFRNFIAHGNFGMTMGESKKMSITKRVRSHKGEAKKYFDITPLDKEIIDKKIKDERAILNALYELRMNRMKSAG